MLANRIAHVACCHHPQERSQAHKRSLLRHTRTRCLRPLTVTPRSPHEPTAATVLSYAQVSGAGAIPQQVQDPADYDIWAQDPFTRQWRCQMRDAHAADWV